MSKSAATMKYLRIGQIAGRTGVSPKALRLYEARGLLAPDGRSAAGYRLYGAKALTRLAEIGVLKRAGFTLAEIGKLLEHDGSAAALVEARIVALREEVRSRSRALVALEHAWRGLASASQTIDQLVEDIQMNEELDMRFSEAEMAEFKRRAEMLGKHFTPEERERVRRRAEELGESRIQQVNAAWPKLIAEVRAAMDTGVPPTDPAVQDMGRRWYSLIQAFTGGDAAIGRRLREAYDQEPQVMAAQGMDHAMFAYIRQAMQAAGLELSA
ncbi:MAG: MerR family transcriptional regulator [Rhodanobacteraceae bacterium]